MSISPSRRHGRDALRYLLARRLVNRAKDVRRRMREPRYLLGAVLGVAYFGGIAFFVLSPGEDASPSDVVPVLITVAAPLLAVFNIAWWGASKSHTALAFDPAEVQILFQAPLTRRALVRYKLVRAQGGLLLTALFFALFLRGELALPYPHLVLTLWAILATVHMHQMAAALVRARVQQARQQGRGMPWLALACFGTWVALLVVGHLGWVDMLRSATTPAVALLAVDAVRAHPLALLALLPIEILLDPLRAESLAAWLWSMAGACSLLALHYRWILHTDAAFEEGAAEAGEEAAAMMAAAKQGRLLAYQLSRRKKLPPPWFGLPPEGHPAFALFWKNFVQLTRALHPAFVWTLVGLFSALFGLLWIADGRETAGLTTAGITGFLGAYSILLGPFAQRNDLRTDLQRAEMLRTYPLDGPSVAVAEVASSTVGLTLVQAGLFLLSLAFVLAAGPDLPYAWLPSAAFVAAVVSCVPLNALGLVIQNLLAVLFPVWYQLGPQAKQGVDAIGGGIVLFLLSGVALAVCLAAPVAFGGGVGLVLWPSVGIVAAAPGLAAAWTLLAAEIVVLVMILGRLYDDLDPVDAGLLR